MNKLNDITINRLRVNTPKNDAKQVAFSLENQSLLEQYDYRKWVFVRELNVHGNPRELNQKASHLLTQSLQQGVHGGYSAANSANVVYFNNLPELLVFLLQDCVNNSLLNKWYWYAWHKFVPLPKAERVYTILLENIEHLPTVTALLLEQKMIQPVWQQLTHSSAKQLLVSIQQRQPLDFRASKPYSVDTANKADLADSTPVSVLMTHRFVKKANKPLSTFRRILSGLPESDARVQLATELIIRMYSPLLNKEYYREIRSTVSRSLVQQRFSSVEKKTIKQNRGGSEGVHNDKTNKQNIVYLKSSLKNNASKKSVPQEAQSQRNLSDNQDENYDQSVHKKITTKGFYDDQKNPEKETPENSEFTPDSIDDPDSQLIFEEIDEPNSYTQWGGFFYLINLLKTPKCQLLLAADETTPSAWLWLFDLSRRLSCDVDKPLQYFIAEQAGFDSIDELLSWPPIDEVGDVFNMLSQYEKITQDPLQWLGLNAKVFANKSHIDCYFSLDDVQLDIRMMGLDINPGWVPWLGRIVTFYYE